MIDYKEDIKSLREFLVSAFSDYARTIYGRLQLWCVVQDCMDGQIKITFSPVINKWPLPRELVESLKFLPVGSVESFGDGNEYFSYFVPLNMLPVDIRSRRGRAISSTRRYRSAHEKYHLLNRTYLDLCVTKEKLLEEYEGVDMSSIVKAIDDKLLIIEKLRRRANKDRFLEPSQEILIKQNEEILKDIALHLGILEGPGITFSFHVKGGKYLVSTKSQPKHPR